LHPGWELSEDKKDSAKPVLTRPEAIIPATKYCENVTPGAIVSLKTEPKIASKMTGNNRVKTTDSR